MIGDVGKAGNYKRCYQEGANSNGVTVLMAAAFVGDITTVKMLLNRGVDVNAKDRFGLTALRNAASRGHTDIVQLLQQAGDKQ